MILNESFKSIGDYFKYEEEYLGKDLYTEEKIMYKEWFGVDVSEILFTTSDDDYDFMTKVLVYMDTATPIKVVNYERFYITDGGFKFTYYYHDGGLCEVKFRESDKEVVGKYFK
jgi:hypothetical protein